jgi:hypothetical protein
MARKSWSIEDEQFIRDNYGKLPYAQMALELGRTEKAVRSRAKVLKITVSRSWSDTDLKLLRDQYPHTPTKEIAVKLGKKLETVYSMADKLGLKKTEEYLASPAACRLRRGDNVGAAFRFKKGQAPPNKGLRRPGWAPGRMAETQFRKGERRGVAVKLYQPVGTERISKDGYRERKINDDMPLQKRWKAVHRIVWEEHNGPIPKGHAVVFKDGNKENCEIDNLELVTRRELMSRNTLHNYPEPVRQMVHTLAGFRRKLNDYAKKQDRRSEESAL